MLSPANDKAPITSAIAIRSELLIFMMFSWLTAHVNDDHFCE